MTKAKPLFQDCEDYEMCGGRVIPEDFLPPVDPVPDQKPGIFRTWRGLVAAIGWVFFAYLVICIGVRIFN